MKDLYRQLATLYDAGLSPIDAFDSLRTRSNSKLIDSVLSRLKRGNSVADALRHTQLVDKHSIAVLRVAEQSGKLGEAFHYIAEKEEFRASNIKQFVAQLWLPFLLLLVGLICGLILQAAAGDRDISRQAVMSIFILALACLSTIGVVKMLTVDSVFWLSLGWQSGIGKHLSTYQDLFELHFYRLLTWQVASGMSLLRSFKTLESYLPSNRYQDTLDNCQKCANSGMAITTILIDNGLMFNSGLRQASISGEHTGQWQNAVSHYLAGLDTRVTETTRLVFTWLPRVYFTYSHCLSYYQIYSDVLQLVYYAGQAPIGFLRYIICVERNHRSLFMRYR